MPRYPFKKGLVEIAPGAHAYLQPDGNWGYSNAGFVRDADQMLLVDTLFDERLTNEMLASLAAIGCKADAIGKLVNTHANGDHTNGNALVPNAQIYASERSAREIAELPPSALAALKVAGAKGDLGDGGRYFAEIFQQFDFAGSRGRPPTRTFTGRLTLDVGDKPVHLIEVGPAHTAGDVLAHSPKDKTIFTGDILFIDSTPIMWAGPVQNWLRACDLIADLDVETIVPGHGPITDKSGVRKVADYLRFVDREARARFAAGMSSEDAALDIALGEYDAWGDAERIAVNVETCYRAYRATATPVNPLDMFARMARVHAARKRRRARLASSTSSS
jgi:glyoxylase-like metal-dependent hydrolase (beta-lactamase superfamily II)